MPSIVYHYQSRESIVRFQTNLLIPAIDQRPSLQPPASVGSSMWESESIDIPQPSIIPWWVV